MHAHLLAPLFVPGASGENDAYRPAVICVKCRKEFTGKRALERAIAMVRARGLGPVHEVLLRRQFARDGYR